MEFVKDYSQPNEAQTSELIERDIECAEYSGNAPFIAVQAPSQGGLQSSLLTGVVLGAVLASPRNWVGTRIWAPPQTFWAA